MNELDKMPELALKKQLDGLNISLFILDKNFEDLINVINWLGENPKADYLFWGRNRDKLNYAMKDVIRLLHNFVAASLSLIDHTRRLYRKLYAENEKFPEYQDRVNTVFINDPLSQFVKDLRRYCQHYKAPNLVIDGSWEKGDEKLAKTFNLLKDNLLTFGDWSKSAKEYLRGVEEEVNILWISTEYMDKVVTFYNWFQTRQIEIHRDELRRLEDKQKQLMRLVLEDNIDMSFATSQSGIPHKKDEIFAQIFSSMEFEELEQIPRNTTRRPLRAIELLEQRFFTISDQTKERIMQLYQLPDIVPAQD